MEKQIYYVIQIGLVIMVGMGLFPPWIVMGGAPLRPFFKGYAFLFEPNLKVDEIDIKRLVVQWIIVLLVVVIIIYGIRQNQIDKINAEIDDNNQRSSNDSNM